MDAADEAVLLEDRDRRLRNQQMIAEGDALRRTLWLRIALACVRCRQQYQVSAQVTPAGSHRRPARAAGTAQ
jgi:predicted RNA polymerase sigma factor